MYIKYYLLIINVLITFILNICYAVKSTWLSMRIGSKGLVFYNVMNKIPIPIKERSVWSCYKQNCLKKREEEDMWGLGKKTGLTTH